MACGHAVWPRFLLPAPIQSSLWPVAASILPPEGAQASAAFREDRHHESGSQLPPGSLLSGEDCMLSPQHMADRLLWLLCLAHGASFAYLSLSLISFLMATLNHVYHIISLLF